ncbi:Low-affinity potassium transport protein [Termitomyces sp. T112]|nr:Low-affinity potassium transport protein [Termitomyces sp. T112]
MEHNLTSMIPIDRDLCDLLQSMKLSTSKAPGNDAFDVPMLEDITCATSAGSPPSTSTSVPEYYGCEYLQTMRRQLDNYITTGGEYLEAIFTHREILSSFPSAHHQCARAFSDIAYLLEQRAWRADRDADTEAVSAFRHEEWTIANTLMDKSSPSAPALSFEGRQSYVCVMPVM